MNELLTCEGLTKSYQKGTNALDNIELHIGFGRIVGLLGPNGSGKTTLIKLANGLLQPTAGSIRIAGMAPGPDTKAIVSYLPDAAWLPALIAGGRHAGWRMVPGISSRLRPCQRRMRCLEKPGSFRPKSNPSRAFPRATRRKSSSSLP